MITQHSLIMITYLGKMVQTSNSEVFEVLLTLVLFICSFV